MGAMASQITILTIVYTPFIQAQIKENINIPSHCLCEGNSHVTGDFPAQRATDTEIFPFDDVLVNIKRNTTVSSVWWTVVISTITICAFLSIF